MKFKLENIKFNVAEEIQFELGKIEVEYSLEEMVEMHQNLREVIQQVRELILISQDTPEEKKEAEPNTQMQDIFNKFADILGKDNHLWEYEKQNKAAQEEN